MWGLEALTLWQPENFKQNCLEARIRNRSDRFWSKTRAHNKKKSFALFMNHQRSPFSVPRFSFAPDFFPSGPKILLDFSHIALFIIIAYNSTTSGQTLSIIVISFCRLTFFWRRLELLLGKSNGLQMTSVSWERLRIVKHGEARYGVA